MPKVSKGLRNLLAAAFPMSVSVPVRAALNCGGPTLNANLAPYNTLHTVTSQNVGIDDEDAVRIGQMTAMAGEYRSKNGPGTLGPGKPFGVIYENRSKECGIVITTTGSTGAVPVPGSKRAPPREGLAVENTNMYIRQFQRNGTNGFYQVCYDYYSNGELTETQCSVQPW
jgi:hypothetical protein